MKLDIELFKRVAPKVSDELRNEYVLYFNIYCVQYHITKAERLRMFFANIMVESQRLARTSENLNYSADRLMQVWPSRFPSRTIAETYAHSPYKLANYVYGGRLGNRPGTDDGWFYRGGGFLQTTGRANHESLGNLIGLDLVTNPDYLKTPKGAIESACAEWYKRGCNALADKGELTQTRERINGGHIGLQEVKVFYSHLKVWIPDDFVLIANGDAVVTEPLATAILDENSEHIEGNPYELNLGSPGQVDLDAGTSNAATSPALNQLPIPDKKPSDKLETSANGQSEPQSQIVYKERPSTFMRTVTAAKVAFGALLASLSAWCGSNQAAQVIAQKASERAIENVDRSFLADFGIVLLYTAVGIGAGVFLMWVGMHFYDKSAERANRLNQEKVQFAADPLRSTVEFTRTYNATTAVMDSYNGKRID